MTWIRCAGREGIGAAATVFALACCGGDGPSGNAASIQVAANPAALSVPQGDGGTVTISLIRGGGFSGAVSLAITGLPTGVATSITPAQLTGTTASATVNVTVLTTLGVLVGTHRATVTATAQGVALATTTFVVTVTAAPNYELEVAPDPLSIAAGASGSATVIIDRTNFTGGVALALLTAPAGITGAFNPTPSTTNQSALVVSVAATVAPGNYPITIQGTAAGPGVKTTTLTVAVTAPASVRATAPGIATIDR
jgi:hypothetical protein